MKKIAFAGLGLSLLLVPALVFAQSADLVLPPESVRFSTSTFIEGKVVRIYASVKSTGGEDRRGVVKFFAGPLQITGDQPVSVLAGKEDAVFVDWSPVPGEQIIKITVTPFDGTDANFANNTFQRTITVLADSDRDGTPNATDADDDNDGVADTDDAFPLNKKESVDSDGDGKGNNEDTDDDNDGVADSEDALPFDALESHDTDKDGIGDNTDTDDDGDGITDIEELKNGLDPLKKDSDGDGVEDGDDKFPKDSGQAHDTDADGIGDSLDSDGDNDGIPKDQDIDDANQGPTIKITTYGKSPKRISFINKEVSFETTGSTDPDGTVHSTKWKISGRETAGDKVTVTFEKSGLEKVEVTVFDDKGEPRSKTFKILVISPILLWTGLPLIFIIAVLALFLTFSYSKPRV